MDACLHALSTAWIHYHPVNRIADENVQVVHNGCQVQCHQQDLLFLHIEQKRKEVLLQTIDRTRGMAVALPTSCSIDGDCSDHYEIVDIQSISKKTRMHDELEAILPEPVQIMHADRLRRPIARYVSSATSFSSVDSTPLGTCTAPRSSAERATVNLTSFYKSPVDDSHGRIEPLLASYYEA